MDSTNPSHVYIVRTASDTVAFLCPYKAYQRLNQLYAASPTTYRVRRDFVEMTTALQTSDSVEMLTGIFVSRYHIQH
jgi:hypothetical protein